MEGDEHSSLPVLADRIMLLPDDLLPKLDKGRFLGRVWRLEKQEQRKLSQMIDQTDNDAACLAALTLMLEKGTCLLQACIAGLARNATHT